MRCSGNLHKINPTCQKEYPLYDHNIGGIEDIRMRSQLSLLIPNAEIDRVFWVGNNKTDIVIDIYLMLVKIRRTNKINIFIDIEISIDNISVRIFSLTK